MNLPSKRVSICSTAHLWDDKGEIVAELTWTHSKLNDYKEVKKFMAVIIYRSQFDDCLA